MTKSSEEYTHKGIRSVLDDIYEERQRQIDVEGWTPEHDDEHSKGEMAYAAAAYAVSDDIYPHAQILWPWDERWWKPSNRRRNLIKAAALLVAEIERLDRAALEPKP